MGQCASQKPLPPHRLNYGPQSETSTLRGSSPQSKIRRANSILKTQKKQERRLLNELFDKFDNDKDGFLNLKEIDDFLRHLYSKTYKNAKTVDETVIINFIKSVGDRHS